MASLDVPPSYAPPPPPKRPVRPKITLQIPDAPTPMTPRTASVYWTPGRYPKVPGTPGSHMSDPVHPYFSPFGHMYHNKASEFMFKQFEGFKDFTIHTAKSGLSVGEKSAFWFYNKLRVLSKKWFTHLFLTFSLVLYSVIGAGIFMALERFKEFDICLGRKAAKRFSCKEYIHYAVVYLFYIVARITPVIIYLALGALFILCQSGGREREYDRNLTFVRRELADRVMDIVVKNNITFQDPSLDFLTYIEDQLATYETDFTECMKHLVDNNTHKMTWSFWNSMFYAGTIYTTIAREDFLYAVMSEEATQEDFILTLQIPVIRAEAEAQTSGQLVTKVPDVIESENMEPEQDKQGMSIRKRRNLSKNRGQATRQREKTPEPNRTPMPHEDTPTSEDEDDFAQHNPRETEADDTYEEMKRLVQERAKTKDPVYDLDTDEILEARAMAQSDRRRRSISPFAILDKEQEEASKLERKGSFMDPTNKLLSTNYIISPKDDSRRGSLVIEPPKELMKSLSPPSSATTSLNEQEFSYTMQSAPKKQEQMVYLDEIKPEGTPKKPKTPVKNETIFTFDEKDTKQSAKTTLKAPETPGAPGELVTKVIQVERSPSKKLLAQDKRPIIEIRERIIRTPSKKTATDAKPIITKQMIQKEEPQPQSKVPPVKPARSKSATRFGNKTSESEMSEDQANQNKTNAAAKRKVVPTPRRFQRNRSPKANRSQSVNRAETVKVIDRIDKTGTGMSQTSREILDLMQKARARSLSIPKDDPRLLSAYKISSTSKGKVRELKTPNKTPNNLRQSRGISCPKTIQIISDKEILSGLTNNLKPDLEKEKQSRQSSGYVDASQSECTSSCYSSSPSENEYEFDLSERTAELTRKLNILSQEVDNRETINNILLAPDDTNVIKTEIEKPVHRKRSVAGSKAATKKETKEVKVEKVKTKVEDKKKQAPRSRWGLLTNWQQFKQEQSLQYNRIILLSNRCFCDVLLLIIMCGLGGMMFKTLEGSFENAYKCGSRGMKRDFIESLWRGSHYLREEDWKSMARTKLYEFENQLHSAHEAGVTSYSGQRSWNFMNSFVYCMTLVTTIGYGHIAPKTTYGRVATIVYAVIGIPLFLIVLADFGKLFTRIIKFFWSFIRRFYYTRSCRKVRRTVPVQEVMKGLNIVYDVVRRPSQIFSEEDEDATNEAPVLERKPSDVPPPLPPKPSYLREPDNDTELDTPAPSVFEIDDEFNLPISLAIIILVVYIVIGALGFTMWEKWNFFESFYFVFISMSTIGLGDYVPDHPMFMMASIFYLVFGLALTSMCINVVQVKLSNTFKQASAKLGATIGLKVAEEDGSLVPNTPPATEIAPVHKAKVEIDERSREPNASDSKNR